MSGLIDPVRLKELAQVAALPLLAQSQYGFDPFKITTTFSRVLFLFISVFVLIWEVAGGGVAHEQMDFNLKFHTAEEQLQSGTA